MIWFLLYPFRGTTSPPVLPSNHPIRRAFHHHGHLAATYWLWYLFASILISVTVLYTFFIGSPAFSTLPGHGWTYANTFDSGQGLVEDVIVRRVWIHGDRMGALNPHVLSEALQIQNALIYDQFPANPSGNGLHQSIRTPLDSCGGQQNQFGTDSWGFHSPLMFWNCSDKAILNDKNHLLTIQQGSDLKSYRNLTLLPASVFSGKNFAGKKLLEADALVITHFDTSLSPGATKWDARLVKLAAEYSHRWLFYPSSGVMATNQLYEYQREQFSAREMTVLSSIYALITVFLIYRLQDAPAVRSRLGLIAAMVTDMAISIIASFSICSLLKVDLSRVPRELYPFVVIVIGIENMLRLVSAALDQPPQTETTKRIATAVARAGHVSLASTTQILLVLWFLSRVVSSSIQAFCVFVGFALLFDFCFHLIFFVAVLSVDVQRMELQDSLDRAESKGDRQRARKTQSWFDAVVKGKLPRTSRVLGSVISICFVLGLNMHITDLETFIKAVWGRTVEWVPGRVNDSVGQQSVVPPSVNQARTPQEWLRLQDHQFAQEVIDSVKPGARSMIARVYEPVVIVLNGSNRESSQASQGLFRHTWLSMHEHILPVLFIIALFIGLLGPLMDYLLWDNRTDAEKEAELREKHSLVHIRKLPAVPSLDIYRLGANLKGHTVVVGLDQAIAKFSLHKSTQKYKIEALPVPNHTDWSVWPVSQIIIDDTGEYLAISSSRHNIGVFHKSIPKWARLRASETWSMPPCLMTFIKLKTESGDRMNLLVVTPTGSIWLFDVESQEAMERVVCDSIVSAVLALTASGNYVLLLNKAGQMHTVAFDEEQSSAHPFGLRQSSVGNIKGQNCRAIRFLQPLNVVAAIKSQSVEFYDFTTGLQITKVSFDVRVLTSTVRIVHSLSKECRNCRSPAAHSISIAYTEAQSRQFVLKTFTATEGEHPLICFHPTTNSSISSCQTIERCTSEEKIVTDPGQWEATTTQSIIGIRPRKQKTEPNNTQPYSPIKSTALSLPISDTLTSTTPRNRFMRHASSPTKPTTADQSTISTFEVWTISPITDIFTLPIPHDKDDLFVVSAGPLAALGASSVAIALGNSVRVVTVGSDRIEEAKMEPWSSGSIANGKGKGKEVKRRKGGSGSSA